jgi:DNA-binding HxlR family transcriptional regulator
MLMSDGISANPTPPYVILTGNPNCGKTSLVQRVDRACAPRSAITPASPSNARKVKLLGATRQKSAISACLICPAHTVSARNSLDEQISRDVLLNRLPELPPPGLIVVVVDASNLQRNLYYATQVIELGHPTLIALNMVDVAEANGHRIDEKPNWPKLLGVPVLAGGRQQWRPACRNCATKIIAAVQNPPVMKFRRELFCQLPGLFRIEAMRLGRPAGGDFSANGGLQATAEALLLLSNEKALALEPRNSLSAKNPGRRGCRARKRLENARHRLARRAH